MKPSYSYFISLAILTSLSGLELLQGRVVHERHISVSENDMKTVNCATKMREEKCSTFRPAQNYSLMLSSPVYSPRQEIKVKVFMMQCPSMDLPGPSWYQLEIVASTDKPQTSKSIGEFYAQRSHIHICNHRSRVVFASCDPMSFDLPGSYLWIAPNTLAGEICFRLTVQQGEADESCEEKIVCTEPTESESSGQEVSDNHSEEGSGSYDYSDGDDSDTKSEHPTTLTDPQDQAEEDKDTTEFQETPLIGSTTCEGDRQLLLNYNYPWIPRCDCHGFYEPVQCQVKGGQLECWCSTKTGSIIGTKRTIFSCTDPEQLDFDCTGAS